SGTSLDTTSNEEGFYEFTGLAPGSYTLKAAAKGFTLFTKENVQILVGQVRQLNISLTIEAEEQKVEVTDSPTKVDVDPSNNAGMVVMKGKDLEALSDDPDELRSELEALAGPSAGPNGGQIYIDGFTAGTLPPKASIREIRINQNPFSSEYDKLGYGRVEIFTKPGTDLFHGQLFLTGSTSAFNSRNPFEVIPPGTQPPDYHSTQFSANVGGPLVSKRASFFFNIERRDLNELSVVSAQIVDPTTLAITPFSDAVPNPRMRTNLSPRLDYQVSANNTLTARYQYVRKNESNNGIGRFNLQSLGFHQVDTEHQFQISDTQVVNSKTINETRFQFVRETSDQTPLSTAPTCPQISGLDAYLITLQSLASGNTQANLQNAIAQGGGASFYSVTIGNSIADVTYFDAGLYIQDDWRIRPNITFSYGLRLESQNDFSDHADLAPRIGIAWRIDGSGKKSPKTVLRAGFVMLYDRFPSNLSLQQERLNGTTENQYLVTKPAFFDPSNTVLPSDANFQSSTAAPQTIYQPNQNLRAPYTMQTGITLE